VATKQRALGVILAITFGQHIARYTCRCIFYHYFAVVYVNITWPYTKNI